MQPRTNPYAVAPAQLKQFLDYSDTVHQSGL